MKKVLRFAVVILLVAVMVASLTGCMRIADMIHDFTGFGPQITREESGLGPVETDLLVGTWAYDDSYGIRASSDHYVIEIDYMTFTEDGYLRITEVEHFPDMEPFESRSFYSASSADANIIRSVILDENNLFVLDEKRAHRQDLMDNAYFIEFDLEPFGAQQGMQVFNREAGTIQDPFFDSAWGGEDFISNMAFAEGRKLDGDSGISLLFHVADINSAINEVLTQSQTSGEVEVQVIESWDRTPVEGVDDMPNMLTFNLRPFTSDDFLEMYTEVSYFRVEDDSLREFLSLEAAQGNSDDDLVWAGTRR